MTPDASPAADDVASPENSDQEREDMVDLEDQKQRSGSSDASPPQQATASSEEKPRGSAKDPQRPRRKKARRACFACQRAHLTCGDERPCQRCIKRGLQDACQDGVRKKAKYLHDAPNEALMPGLGGVYHHHLNGRNNHLPTTTLPSASVGHPGLSYQTAHTPTYDIYGQPTGQAAAQMPPPPLHTGSYSGQNTPISPHFANGSTQPSAQVQAMVTSSQAGHATLPQMQQFANPLFDPSDPALFNFDIGSLNFASNYSAMEFGMLGHMASGTADTPPENHHMGQMSQANYGMSNYSDVFAQDHVVASDWHNHQRQGSQILHTPQNTPVTTSLDMIGRHDSIGGQPHAYAIGAGPSSLSSASPASHDVPEHDNGHMSPAYYNHQDTHQQQTYTRPANSQHQQQQRSNITLTTLGSQSAIFRKRRRNTSVYSSVTEPYPYTTGFHSLTAILQSRFATDKRLRIAKALASIRPSFISVTNELNRDDLIFMEQSFQRALEEYENFITLQGSPTIILRRTGEVAAVSKEFCDMTKWKRNVLLGKELNLNVNTGQGPDEGPSATGRGSNATPRMANAELATDNNHPHPVFIAELLDDDSVVEFYEDFAKLAFGDAHGTAMRPCRLLKYRTKEDVSGKGTNRTAKNGTRAPPVKLEHGISNEASALGDKDGKIDCMMIWSVKRDLFEVPMMIIINFLPCI